MIKEHYSRLFRGDSSYVGNGDCDSCGKENVDLLKCYDCNRTICYDCAATRMTCKSCRKNGGVIKAMQAGKSIFLSCKGKTTSAPRLEDDEQCPDCGRMCAPYHHPSCDWVRCPFCGHQMLSCDCDINYQIIERRSK